MAKNLATKVIMITGAGAQEFDSDEFNSALETVQAGGQLSPEQSAIANALKASPTQRNIFNSESGTGEIKPISSAVAGGTVSPVNTVAPVPTTASAQSDVSKRIQGFLGGLGVSSSGQAAGNPAANIANAANPLGSGFDMASLQSQLVSGQSLTNAANANANRQQAGNVATFGDPDKIEANENLMLDLQRRQLEEDKFYQNLQDQVRAGIIPGAAKVTNRLGKPVLDLARIGLTPDQTSRNNTAVSSLVRPRGLPGGTLFNTRSTIIGR
jgi:hypothetical protein